MRRALIGIRRRRNGWRVEVRVRGRLRSKQFPLSTPVSEMRAWRDQQIAAAPPPARDTRPWVPRPAHRAVIYFVQGDTHVKIGRTTNLTVRLTALQAASPVPLRLLATLTEGATDEATLHRRFAHLRVHGEWFQQTAELQAFVDAVSREASCPAN